MLCGYHISIAKKGEMHSRLCKRFDAVWLLSDSGDEITDTLRALLMNYAALQMRVG